MSLQFDPNLILNTSIGFLFALLLKFLLDLKLAIYAVKFLHFLPVRTLFRSNPPEIKGEWQQSWFVKSSTTFDTDSSRQSAARMRQLGSYCYSEFHSGDDTYVLFGKLDRDQFVGEWHDLNDSLGYSGSFHLIVKSGKQMEGKWIGNSKTTNEVKSGDWQWVKK
ncbi:hypothetical protein [Vibrio proteolyticus]|uniref:SMODS-associating 2TM beta-strand rich effector domain-containing protein n=1 Tax=Vibrio proteolyticus NBRC 13287 TaxID=1219065 RepID=U2ZYZ5_VIBPR|nr:hypothetical protein [Vibrio proteolyticus]GAD66660.1 hypothetical protein VPR01S_04_02640 [Vibrio proteolyticus NBRC 13287]